MANGQVKDTMLADFIWKNAEDLWGDFRHTEFGKVILPFTLLRRLECVLEASRVKVRAAHKEHKDSGLALDSILRQLTGLPFYNTSEYALDNLGSTKTRQNLEDYVSKFSDNARAIFEQFEFASTITKLDKAGILFRICNNFSGIDLHPAVVPDRVMSNIYEHLIRRFGAAVNEGAEDFMTPRDVVHLATTLLLDPDDKLFESNPGLIRTLYDPILGIAAAFNQACAAIQCSSKLTNQFLFYFLMAAYSHLRSLGNEASQTNLSLEIIKEIRVPLPSLAEQEAICRQLEASLSNLDCLAGKVGDSLALLNERRTALITAAVTGQIDLREDIA